MTDNLHDKLYDLVDDATEFGQRDYHGAVRDVEERLSDHSKLMLAVDEVEELVTRETAKAELRGRIAEIKSMRIHNYAYTGERQVSFGEEPSVMSASERIAVLEKQLKEAEL